MVPAISLSNLTFVNTKNAMSISFIAFLITPSPQYENELRNTYLNCLTYTPKQTFDCVWTIEGHLT